MYNFNRTVSPINWNPSRHRGAFAWLFVFCVGRCFVCLFGFVFGVLFVVYFLFVFHFLHSNVTRDLDYVSVLYQFSFVAIRASAPARVN